MLHAGGYGPERELPVLGLNIDRLSQSEQFTSASETGCPRATRAGPSLAPDRGRATAPPTAQRQLVGARCTDQLSSAAARE